MTRKDYQLIASVIRERVEAADQAEGPHHEGERRMAWDIASALGYELQRTNPGFQREKFIDACGF